MTPSRMLSHKHSRMQILFFLLTVITGGMTLKDVMVVVPAAANIGDTVTLQCRYDLEGEPLYTLKWYKGVHEFYRFIPKEMPNTQVFSLEKLGIDIDLSKSTQNSVVLRNLQPEQTGRYRCEVSSDYPNFYTRIVNGYMYVIKAPEKRPEMVIEKDSYEIGYTLRGNCTTPPSYPAVNVTWFLNGKKINESSLIHLPDPNSNSVDGKRRPVITVAGLEHEIESDTFRSGKANISCRAEVFNLYNVTVNVILEEERPRPRPSSVLGTRDAESGSASLQAMCFIKMAIILALIMR